LFEEDFIMKTKLAILIALAATGVSGGVYAQLPAEVPAPAPAFAGEAPKLYPSEQGAFKALEVINQVMESRIVQKGCQAISFNVEVHTGADGSGTASLGNALPLKIAFLGSRKNDGRWYGVTGAGSVNGMTVPAIAADGSFNIGSSIQELSTIWQATSYVTGLPDTFRGTIIKDYSRLLALQNIPTGFDDAGTPVSMVIDYGYQQVAKNHFVKGKYWQQSATWRDDGVNAGTWWLKTRVAPAGCIIETKLAGYGLAPTDNTEGFNEMGTISVRPAVVVGDYAKKPTAE
jgi:hypothetical protein